jgi:hypothetical protein
MPYYFGEGDPGWDELDDGRSPHIAQFHYLPAPDFSGRPGPARFSDQVPPPLPPPSPIPPGTPSLLDRLLGRRPRVSAAAARSRWEQQAREREHRGQHLLALAVEALRGIGARSAYCRYDGGNDEGFTWPIHVELRSGERLGPDEVATRLAQTDLIARPVGAEVGIGRGQATAAELRDSALFVLTDECAVRLLGQGFGTGPFYLYGAFTVDLDGCTIVDDRNAGPVVENIDIEQN